MNPILFKEKQRFTQWWLWLLLIVIVGDSLWQTFKTIQTQNGIHFPQILTSVFFELLPAILIIALMGSILLNTEIKPDGIYVKFSPIHRSYRQYLFSDLTSIQIRKYKPLLEYGGWGIRGFGSNKALNISGNIGLQLIFKDGRKLLIGTQQQQELGNVLSQLKNIPFEQPSIA